MSKSTNKVGKLKLNDSFRKKLESSIGLKIETANGSKSKKAKEIINKSVNRLTRGSSEPFVPPPPPFLAKKKEQDNVSNIQHTHNPHNTNNPSNPHHPNNGQAYQPSGPVTINNNINYPQPVNNGATTSDLISVAQLFFDNKKEKKKITLSVSDEKEKVNKREERFFDKKISVKYLIIFFFTFTSGYWLGRISG